MSRFVGEYEETFLVDAPLDRAALHFGNPEVIARNQGPVEEWVLIDPETVRYRLSRKEALGHSFQGEFACRYTKQGADEIAWQSVGDAGNMFVKGRATLKPVSDGRTEVHYREKLECEIPINRLIGKAIAPIVRREIEQGVREFLQRMRSSI